MLKLFKYEGYKVVISEEALLLTPFKKIWDRDRTKNKDKALAELGYIYFFNDPRSEYQYLIDETERHNAIIESEGLGDWKPDKLVKEASEFYNSFKPTSALLLEDTRYAVDKVRIMLREINLSKEDDKGRPVYTIDKIISAIKQVPALVKDLDEAEKALRSEVANMGKMRGQGEKTLTEDGFNFAL